MATKVTNRCWSKKCPEIPGWYHVHLTSKAAKQEGLPRDEVIWYGPSATPLTVTSGYLRYVHKDTLKGALWAKVVAPPLEEQEPYCEFCSPLPSKKSKK